jgi:hypothetical protein
MTLADQADARRRRRWQHKMQAKEWYESLDPGIRFAVKVLHAHGISTGQSCEGGDGHAYDRPTVDLWEDDRTTGFAALHFLSQYALPVSDIARVWNLDAAGQVSEVLWRITFKRSMPERADDWPGFIWGYENDWSPS